jgi:transcription elongation factor Elf1
MLQHVSVVHTTATGGTVAYCSTCDKTFSSPMELKQHVDMEHTRECSFCGVWHKIKSPKSFSKAKNPYNFCDKCNKKLNPVVFIEEISHMIPKGATTIYNVGGLEKKDKKFQKRPAKVSYILVIIIVL